MGGIDWGKYTRDSNSPDTVRSHITDRLTQILAVQGCDFPSVKFVTAPYHVGVPAYRILQPIRPIHQRRKQLGGRKGQPDDGGWREVAAFQERVRRTAGLMVFCDELPDDHNRVELDPALTDEAGIPAPKLFYRRGDNTERMLAYGMERCREAMEAAGAARIVSAEKLQAAPGHYLGTARMGADPERSVVDAWGRAHDVRNLFIIDGSVFTSAGSSVPTSTIQALALRTADYVKDNARELAG